jgi:hypothetical protein
MGSGAECETRLPVGDAAESLMGLLPLLEQRDDTYLKRYQAKMTEWRKQMHTLQNPDRTPIAPRMSSG